MSENAPEIQKLIELCGGFSVAAERFAGVSQGDFSKFRRGTSHYGEVQRARVLAAIKAKENDMAAPPSDANQEPNALPKECPEEIASLIVHLGSKKAAIGLLGAPEKVFYRVLRGEEPLPEGWLIKARAELGLPVLGRNVRQDEKPAEPAGPPIPEFVPWEGKTRKVEIKGKPGSKREKIELPVPLADLVEKYQGSRTNAAYAMGFTPSFFYSLAKGNSSFTEKLQRAAHAALHGVSPPRGDRNSMGEEYDKYTLGLAIVMFNGEAAFDRINDIADILNGRLVFRKNTKGGWLVIYRMAKEEDLAKFKRLALRDANEIVCP